MDDVDCHNDRNVRTMIFASYINYIRCRTDGWTNWFKELDSWWISRSECGIRENVNRHKGISEYNCIKKITQTNILSFWEGLWCLVSVSWGLLIQTPSHHLLKICVCALQLFSPLRLLIFITLGFTHLTHCTCTALCWALCFSFSASSCALCCWYFVQSTFLDLKSDFYLMLYSNVPVGTCRLCVVFAMSRFCLLYTELSTVLRVSQIKVPHYCSPLTPHWSLCGAALHLLPSPLSLPITNNPVSPR